MIRRYTIGTLLLLLLAVASAFEFTGHVYWERTIEFQLGDICDSARFPLTPGSCSGDANNPDWSVEFQSAADRWNVATEFFEITTDPAVGASSPGTCNSNDLNSTFFLGDACGPAFGASTLAVARTFSFTGGEAGHSDVIFNSTKSWGAFDDSLNQHPGIADLRRVAVHELGHVIGLSHPYHSDAIMFFASQDVITPQIDDLGGVRVLYGLKKYLLADDYSGNGKQELVVIRSLSDHSIDVEVRDVDGGVLNRRGFFSSDFTPVDAAMLPDLDGNGSAELAILAIRNSDNRAVVEIRNLSGSASPRLVWFAKDAYPLRMVSVPDADSNGVAELAVLLVRDSDDRVFVEVKNAFGPTSPSTIWYMKFATALDMTVVNDGDSNGVPEIAVLLSRWSDGRGVVDIRNTSSPSNPNLVWAAKDVTSMRVAALDDANNNGTPEVAIHSVRNSDMRNLVEVKNSHGPTQPNTLWFAPGHTVHALAIANDADGNGIPEVGIMSRRNSDGRVLVELKNASGLSNPASRWFSPGFSPVPVLHFSDDLDENMQIEAAAMLFRTNDGRITIEQRNVIGAPNTNNTWISP